MRLGQFLCNWKVGAGKGVWDAKEGKRKVGRTGKEVGMPALDFAVGVTFIRAVRVSAEQTPLQQWKCGVWFNP